MATVAEANKWLLREGNMDVRGRTCAACVLLIG